MPDDIPEYQFKGKESFLVQVLAEAKVTGSNGEGRRLITQGAVRVNDEVISDPNFTVLGGQTYIVKAGKRRFLKIVPK